MFTFPVTILSSGQVDPLAAYWNLTSDGNASRGSTNLSNLGAVTFSGSYAAFGGSSSDGLYAADSTDISIGNAAFTWTTWAYLSSTSNTYFVLQKGFVPGVSYPSAVFEYILYYDASASRFKWLLYDTLSPPNPYQVVANTFGTPSANTFYFLTCYYKPGSPNNEIGISVNNGTFDTASIPISHTDTSTNLTIGYRSEDGSYLNGRIKYIGFFKDEPANIDVSYYYNGGSGRPL